MGHPILLNTEDWIQLFTEARERISHKERWCSLSKGKTRTGKSVYPTHRYATAWSAYGTIEKSLLEVSAISDSHRRVYTLKKLEKLFTLATKESTEGRQTDITQANDQEGHDIAVKILDFIVKKVTPEEEYWSNKQRKWVSP